MKNNTNSARINGRSPSGAEQQANSKGDEAPYTLIMRQVLENYKDEFDSQRDRRNLKFAIEIAVLLTTERLFSDFAKLLTEDSEGFTGYCISNSDFEDLKKRWGFQK